MHDLYIAEIYGSGNIFLYGSIFNHFPSTQLAPEELYRSKLVQIESP